MTDGYFLTHTYNLIHHCFAVICEQTGFYIKEFRRHPPQCADTFPWLRGLSVLLIRRAMSAGTLVPGRVTQAEQAEGEEPDQD